MQKYGKLRGRIIEKYGSISAIADLLSMSRISLSRKLTGKSPFTTPDISEMCKLLSIKESDIGKYFFEEE